MKVVYCHGLPGSPAELRALAPPLAPGSRQIALLDRLASRGESYRENVQAAFDALEIDPPIDVIGFSLGAMAALHIAAYRPAAVRKVILVSPAAPLELGDFLPAMAGRGVFRAARRGPLSLRIFSSMQLALVSQAPDVALKAMFATSGAREQALLAAPTFRNMILEGLRHCLGKQQADYRSELIEYVRPWADIVDRVACAVELRHGSADTWAPARMSRALQQRLGEKASLLLYPELGHYGTLQAALAELL